MSLTECPNCGIDFKYPSKLKTHLERKKPCTSHNVRNSSHNVRNSSHIIPNNFKCNTCEKPFASKFSLERHKWNGCNGKNDPKQCKICMKIFSSSKTRWRHEQNVKCEPYISKEDKLRLRIQELEEQQNSQTNITNNTTNNNQQHNTYAPVYNITYVKESGSLICDNPTLDTDALPFEFKQGTNVGDNTVTEAKLAPALADKINDKSDKFVDTVTTDVSGYVTVTHDLGTADFIAQVWTTTGTVEVVTAEISDPTVNSVVIGGVPSTTYKVILIG